MAVCRNRHTAIFLSRYKYRPIIRSATRNINFQTSHRQLPRYPGLLKPRIKLTKFNGLCKIVSHAKQKYVVKHVFALCTI